MPGRAFVSVTGSEVGPFPAQGEALVGLWAPLRRQLGRPVTLSHGDCVGVDVWSAGVAEFLGWETEAYPWDRPGWHNPKRGYHRSSVIHRPNPDPMDRNWTLARVAIDGLYALPETKHEVMRSGTWSTVRRARKLGRKITLVLPDGEVVEE